MRRCAAIALCSAIFMLSNFEGNKAMALSALASSALIVSAISLLCAAFWLSIIRKTLRAELTINVSPLRRMTFVNASTRIGSN